MQRIVWLPVFLAALCSPIPAQEDGPGRGVARISVINGEVSVRRGDSGDFIAAAINAPLVVHDRLLTGAGSRAEAQFDYSNMVRLAPETELRFSELEYRRYQVQLARGTITFRILRDKIAEVEISTPNISVRPAKKGEYRVTVLEDGTTQISVRSGDADIFTPSGSERLGSGRTMLVRGTPADPEFQMTAELREDEWDRWNERRDRDLASSRSYQYMSTDIYGAEDLDHHGNWVHVSPYGWVWAPRVAAGWAPYRHGRWSWIDWYGWSWVSYDPWGWAPYHYGRWFYSGPHGWCWYPGGFGRHYWSPALVAFLGFGRVGVGIGFGHVGWIPLAPYDPFHRWWGGRYYGGFRNRSYFDNSVRIVNNVNVTNIYRNSRVTNAVTAVDADGFSRGRSGASIRIGDGRFRDASLVQGQLPVTPARESLRWADREAGITRPAVDRDTFYSRRQVAAVDRVPFEDQRRGMERIARTTFGEGIVRGSSSLGNGAVRETRGSEAEGIRRGFDSTSTASAAVEQPGASPGRLAEREIRDSEWRRFGAPRPGVTSNGLDAGRVRGSSDAGWRRAGELDRTERGLTNRTELPGRGAVSGDGWRRFGSPRTTGSYGAGTGRVRGESPSGAGTALGGVESTRGGESSWQRLGTSRLDQGDAGSGRGSAVEGWRRGGAGLERQDTWRSERPAQRESFPRMEGGSDPGDSIRISPPIVRERSSGFGGIRRGSDSGGFSRPGGSFGSPRVSGGSIRGGSGGMRSSGGAGSARGSGGSGSRGGRTR